MRQLESLKLNENELFVGDKLIGAVIFVIFFIIFALVSLIPGIQLPPAQMLLNLFTISISDPLGIYIIAILNGLIYGFIFWLISSIANLAMRRGKVARAPPPAPAVEPTEPIVKPVARARILSALDQGIEQIEGIGPSHAEKLRGANITTVKDLLRAGATKKGRQTLAKITDATESTVLKWVNRADLFRIKGIGKEYSELLDVAGVDTVVELSRRDPASLRAKLEEVNREKGLVKLMPSIETIAEWIRHAKRLKRRVEY